MEADRWQQIQELFQTLLERTETEREKELAKHAADDPDLVEEVRTLLGAHPTAEASLSLAVGRAAESASQQQREASAPRSIGRYVVLGQLGEGGMSTVYLAERNDESFRQQVAVKVVRPELARPSVLERFRSERRILARLAHPGIARILDGGTTEGGLPYLVMELIRGEAIDVYCDQCELSLEARLQLFLRICEAVQYAHQNLVIHRDLKPQNILVTKEGEPRLLDFGIAKILDPGPDAAEIEQTREEDRALSVAYASPEQLRGESISTATDIYSLGVILHKLLTGLPPYALAGLSRYDAMRTICEGSIDLPSQLANAPELRGDLDGIMLRCLENGPRARYAGAEALAADVRAYLRDEPVSAAQSTRSYLLRKFVKRNARTVAAVGSFVGLLLVALTIISSLWVKGQKDQRERVSAQHIAERRFQETHELVKALLYDIYDLVEFMPGATEARQSLVHNALLYLDALIADTTDDLELRRELAVAYVKIGDVQGNPSHANLGDTDGALKSYRKAEQVFADPSLQSLAKGEEVDLALIQDKIGEVLLQRGDTLGAYEQHQSALLLRLRDGGARDAVAQSHNRLGNALLQLGRRSEAKTAYESAIALQQAVLDSSPSSGKLRRSLAASRLGLGATLVEQGAYEDGLAQYRQAVSDLEDLVEAKPRNTRWQRDLSVGYTRIVRCLMNMDDPTEALAYSSKAATILEAILAADPANANVRRELSLNYLNRGYLHARLGDSKSGLANYEVAQRMIVERSLSDPANLRVRRDLWLVTFRRASLYSELGRSQDAAAEYQVALARAQELVARDSANTVYERFLAITQWHLGAELLGTDNRSGWTALESALVVFRGLASRNDEDEQPRNELRRYLTRTANLADDADEPARAQALREELAAPGR